MTIKRHPEFRKWHAGIADLKTRNIIAAAIAKLPFGIGDVKALSGSNVFELRIHYGPGYRVYFVKRGGTVIVLLAGGTKRSQKRDIRKAEDRDKEV